MACLLEVLTNGYPEGRHVVAQESVHRSDRQERPRIIRRLLRKEAESVRLTDAALALVTLSVLAVGLPVVATLGNGPTFFVAHRAPVSQILGVLLVALAAPAFVAVLVLSLFWIVRSEGLRSASALSLIGFFSGFLALLNLSRIVASTVLLAILASAFGVAAGLAYWRWISVRRGMRELAFGALVIPAWFIFISPASGLFGFNSSQAEVVLRVENPIPVTIVVFDELHIAALLDRDGQVDADRFPNFGLLAEDSTWYRNGVANVEQTSRAIPTLLTGVVQPVGAPAPTEASYPNNILAGLSEFYDIQSLEPVTSICSAMNCTSTTAGVDFAPELYWQDVFAVTTAVLALAGPDGETPLGGRWRDFNTTVTAVSGMETGIQGTAGFKDLLASIAQRPSNQFNFIHLLEPHIPYDRFSDGRTYGLEELFPPGSGPSYRRGWTDDDNLIENAYLRYLHQVGFADKLLGDVVSTLKSANLYGDSLIVVTADHGVAFVPGEMRREVDLHNAREVLQVPFFIKWPNTLVGKVDGSAVDTIATHVDIVPTVFDVIGASMPWQADGASLVSAQGLGRESFPVSLMRHNDGKVMLTRLEDWPGSDRLIEQNASFGDRTSLAEATRYRGLKGHLIGRSLDDFPIAESPLKSEIVAGPFGLSAVRNRETFVPALIRGSFPDGSLDAQSQNNVVIAVDGTIVAVAKTSPSGEDSHIWETIIPQPIVDQPFTDISIFVAVGCEQFRVVCRLLRVDAPDSDIAQIVGNGSDRRIVQRESQWRITDSLGHIDLVTSDFGVVTFRGWAAHPNDFEAAVGVAVFDADRGLLADVQFLHRADVVAHLRAEVGTRKGLSSLNYGWSVTIGAEDALGAGENLRFVALYADGSAGEILRASESVRDFLSRPTVEDGAGRLRTISAPEKIGYVFEFDGRAIDVVDAVGNVEYSVSDGGRFKVGGWSAHGSTCSGPARIFLIRNGRTLASFAPKLVPRPDVQAFLHNNGLPGCESEVHGWEISIGGDAQSSRPTRVVVTFPDGTASLLPIAPSIG